jgi:hypothetical protein
MPENKQVGFLSQKLRGLIVFICMSDTQIAAVLFSAANEPKF